MRKARRHGLTFGAAALVLVLGVACGGRPAQPRYVYYPSVIESPPTSVDDGASADSLPADTSDDPTPASYVDAGPAAVAARPAPAPPPVNLDFGARNAI